MNKWHKFYIAVNIALGSSFLHRCNNAYKMYITCIETCALSEVNLKVVADYENLVLLPSL